MEEQWLDRLRIRMTTERKVRVPEGLLDEVKAEMERRTAVSAPNSRERREQHPGWFYRPVAAAVLLAVGICLGTIFQDHWNGPLQSDEKVSEGISAGQKIGTTPAEAKNDKSFAGMTVMAAERSCCSAPTRVVAPVQESVPECTPKIKVRPKRRKERQQRCAALPEVGYAHVDVPVSEGGQPALAVPSGWKEHRELRFSFSCGGSLGASIRYGDRLTAGTEPISNRGTDFLENGAVTESSEVWTKAEHRIPLNIGFSVACSLADRWSLQTGVTYSRLSSKFYYGDEPDPSVARQTLHYVGIPVGATYRITGDKGFQFYGSAGGEVEKLIKGEISGAGHASLAVREKPLQLSAKCALGAEYSLCKGISLYAEPGMSCHFRNGSDVECIYKERPLNFNLDIGVRIRLHP